MASTAASEGGGRLLMQEIDRIAATDPTRIWASIPVDDNDLTKGFKDISYRQFATAVDIVAHWLRGSVAAEKVKKFETVTYLGPRDVRFPIIAVAAAKVGVKLFSPADYIIYASQAELARNVETKLVLYIGAHEYGGSAIEIVGQLYPELCIAAVEMEIPSLSELLSAEPAKPFPYNKTFEEAKKDPWLIFNTSGTTGVPKPVVYTHEMMDTAIRLITMEGSLTTAMMDNRKNIRWYTPIPPIHANGLFMTLILPIFLHTISVFGPAKKPTDPSTVLQVLQHGNVEGATLPPSIIAGLTDLSIDLPSISIDLSSHSIDLSVSINIQSDPTRTSIHPGLEALQNLQHLCFAGTPLPKHLALNLPFASKIKPMMGCTEAGPYALHPTGPSDWEYYSFAPEMGLHFHPTNILPGNLHEAVFKKDPSKAKYQQIFQLYPDLDEYATGDLFEPHPSKPGFWKPVGRKEEAITLESTAYIKQIFPPLLENAVLEHYSDIISDLQIGGHGLQQPYALIKYKPISTEDIRTWMLKKECLDYMDRLCAQWWRSSIKAHIQLDEGESLERTYKGTLARSRNEERFGGEIERGAGGRKKFEGNSEDRKEFERLGEVRISY